LATHYRALQKHNDPYYSLNRFKCEELCFFGDADGSGLELGKFSSLASAKRLRLFDPFSWYRQNWGSEVASLSNLTHLAFPFREVETGRKAVPSLLLNPYSNQRR
jgi:hypothetical protein